MQLTARRWVKAAASMDFESVVPLIENILVLDADGKRIAVKYHGDPKCVAQRIFRQTPGSSGGEGEL